MQIKNFLDRLDKRSHLDNELRDNIRERTELIEVLLADAPKYNAAPMLNKFTYTIQTR